jgi:hypothetical protein
MSLFKSAQVACPNCGAATRFEAVHSVNVDRRPVLREQILDESFQRVDCAACGTTFRYDPEFHYIDLGRRQWVAALPLAALPNWEQEAAAARSLFERVYLTQGSAHTLEVGRRLRPRVTFGWAALREKVFIAGAGLDDVNVELTKAAVLRGGGELPLAADTELRLVDADADDLILAWMRTQDEALGDMLRVSRSLYAEIAADPDPAWEALRAQIGGSLFVDLNRLLIPA